MKIINYVIFNFAVCFTIVYKPTIRATLTYYWDGECTYVDLMMNYGVDGYIIVIINHQKE